MRAGKLRCSTTYTPPAITLTRSGEREAEWTEFGPRTATRTRASAHMQAEFVWQTRTHVIWERQERTHNKAEESPAPPSARKRQPRLYARG